MRGGGAGGVSISAWIQGPRELRPKQTSTDGTRAHQSLISDIRGNAVQSSAPTSNGFRDCLSFVLSPEPLPPGRTRVGLAAHRRRWSHMTAVNARHPGALLVCLLRALSWTSSP